MFVEGYMLVRPGREQDVRKALLARRRTNVAAVVAGAGVAVAGIVIG